MIRESQPLPDPLIDEVRQRRQRIWDECDHDARKLYERIQRVQREHPDQLIPRPQKLTRAADGLDPG